MGDTGYYVPKEKWDRFTVLYSLDKGKKTVHRSTATAQDSYKQPTTRLGGGSGLVSTTMDYARFCQMLANDGELNGVRILSRKSVELMRADHMPLDMPRVARTLSPGWGFGLTFAVNRGPGKSAMIGSKGEYRWGGAAGTRFWIDPKEEMVTIFMVQILPYSRLSYGREFKRLAYQAIVD
jgi:CubicO group peptidase (beta-lactamase class C family)